MIQTTNRTQYPLLPFSLLVSEDVTKGNGDAWVFHYNLKAKGIDAERLRHAVEYVLNNHPVFGCHIAGSLQQYEDGYRTPYFEYDIREEYPDCILNISFHRILGDGASLVLLLANINKVYKGEKIAADMYLDYLESKEQLRNSTHYASCRQWLEQRYDKVAAPSCPKPDVNAALSEYHGTEATVSRLNIPMKSGVAAKGELLNLATALAIMDYNGTDSAALTWAYLGRETAAEMSVFGSLSRDVPFVLTRTMGDNAATLKAKAHTEIQQGILHSAYPYTFNAANRELWRYAVSVEVQPHVDLAIGDTEWLLVSIADEQPKKAHCFLDVEYHEAEEALLLRYSTGFYKEQSIERFADLIVEHLDNLQAKSSVQRCLQEEEPASDITFMEKFEENVRLYPDKVILQDSETKLTFGELDELSGRVCAYLNMKGIGKEDFVMIILPRSVKCIASMLGVWKAGAALVVCDVWEATERVQYKYRDCNCKLKICSENWEEILAMPSRPHYILADIHDVAYALYTSGSEGNPKGVIHEYGNIDYASNCVFANGVAVYQHDDRVAHPLPMSSTGGMIHALSPLRCGAYVEFLPLSILGNLDELEKHLLDERITVTGLVPSMIGERKIKSPYIKFFLTGSEMTSNVFMEEYPILNMYGQTETSMNPLNFVIDRMYKNTPVGNADAYPDVQLMDDNLLPSKQGEKGEICVPYHYSRGYINDAELTAKVFRDGLFHTGDIARINEDGNYVILGRKTDMIKINGNRIEPAEIEAAVKHVLGIDWAFAKGFVQPERSFICVYYTADIDIDLTAVREELLKILPNYMIPSYFVHIDDVPRLPNGKIDRQAFKAPCVEVYHAAYAAPTNEMEERLCTIMQQILEVERIGIDDDFFLLGGDSLRTIRLATECNIDGLTVSDIYAARTPRGITERWMLKQME